MNEYEDAATLLDTAPCGFLVIEPVTTAVVFVNATLCNALGRPRSSIVGGLVADLFTEGSGATLDAVLHALREPGVDTPVGATAELRSKTGISVSIMANAVQTPAGISVRMTLHSTTERYVRENLLISERDQAEAALGRSQNALEVSEDARKTAEAERTQIQILASTLQRTLLPPILSAPTGMSVAGHYHPASLDEVGGDFYDVFPLDKDTWAFFLGDVSGKGAGAAAVTSLTRYTLRAAAVFDRDPIAVLHNLNTVLHHEFHGDDPRFCTVAYGTITPTTQGAFIELASGGHPPALHLRSDGTAAYVLTTGGQLVGALPEPHFTSASVTLEPGDAVVFYTDGLTEAVVGPGRTRYDDDGALESFAAAQSPTTAAGIIEDLTRLLAEFGSGLQDDVALLALGVPDTDSDRA